MNLEDLVDELDSERGVRRLWWAIAVVLALGLAGCLSKGADRPADPVVREAVGTVTGAL